MNDEGLGELRSSLTPYEPNGGVTTYQNIVSIARLACEKPFDDLVVCENDYSSLELSMMLDLCVIQHDGDVPLFTHKQEEQVAVAVGRGSPFQSPGYEPVTPRPSRRPRPVDSRWLKTGG